MKKYFLSIICFLIFGQVCHCQCSNPTTVSLTINGVNQACAGTPITFVATPVGEGSSPVFQWYLGTIPVGDNSSTCTIIPSIEDNGKQITATLISSEICNTGMATSNKILLFVRTPETPSVTIDFFLTTESSFCIGDPSYFRATLGSFAGPDVTYQWYINNIPVDKYDGTVTLHPENGDEVYVTMTSSLECIIGSATVQSNSITVEKIDCSIFSLPISGPTLIQSGELNAVYSVPYLIGSTYDWEVAGGTIVKGKNTNSITVDWEEIKIVDPMIPSRPQYSLTLIETNKTNLKHTTILDIGAVTTSISKSLAQSGITLFPNPTTESFNIEMPKSGIAVNYEVFDLTGASVAQGNFISTSTAEKITPNFGAGMYQVVLRYNDVVTCGRLSKVQ